MNKYCYAAESYMGLNYTYDSPCWSLYAFPSRDARERWLRRHSYNDQGNLVAEGVSRRVALKIWPALRHGVVEEGRLSLIIPDDPRYLDLYQEERGTK